MSNSEAEQYCISNFEGHLAFVDDEGELQSLKRFVEEAGTQTPVHVANKPGDYAKLFTSGQSEGSIFNPLT